MITVDQYQQPQNGSRFGLHWTPVTGHAHSDLTYFIDRTQAMQVKWVLLLDDGGGSVLQPSSFYGGKNICQMFQERDIIPVIRLGLNRPDALFNSRMEDTVGRLVEAGVPWIFWINEPECGGEWESNESDSNSVPADYVMRCTRGFVDGAYKILRLGGYPGFFATTTFRFTDEHGQRVNPFMGMMTLQERNDIFVFGHGWVPIHNYPKNHPRNYPYDAVNQTGESLTAEEYQAAIDQVDSEYIARTGDLWVWDDHEVSEHHINFVRDRSINAGQTLDDDDVCFWMYKGLNQLLADADLLRCVPVLSTEIGPDVGNREDGRYARNLPKYQIAMFIAMLAEAGGISNYLAMFLWLAGVQRLDAATADGFEDQSQWTDRHNDPFKLQGELPFVQHMIDHPAAGLTPIGENVMASKLGFHIQEYRSDVEAALIRAQPTYVKVMGVALSVGTIERIKSLVPDVRIIGRYHVGNESQCYENDPIGRATDLVNLIEATGCGPLVWAWEDYNEVPTSHMSPGQVDAYDQFMITFHRLVYDRFGVGHTVVLNSPVGNLGWPGEVMPTQFYRTLGEPGTVVSFHCYERWKDPSARDAFLFRWVELRRQIEVQFPGKQYILTEIGVTRATIPGEPDVGWRSGDGYSRPDYMDILRDADIKMQEFEDVLAGLPFQTGAKRDWSTFESAEEVADLRQNFIPITPPAPPPPEPPESPPPPATPPGVVNDAVAYGVSIEQADVPEGALYWEVGAVHHLTPNENRGKHHAFVNLFDQEGHDLGAEPNEISDRPQVRVEWPTGSEIITLEKPWPDEPMGNFPLWSNQVASLQVISELDSDRVVGIHTGHPDEPRLPDGTLGNTLNHHSFLVVCRLAIKSCTPSEPPPIVVEPEETLETFMRRKGWDAAGIDYNPDAALFKHAVAHNLGRPVTNEYDAIYDGVTYRCQCFEKGIVKVVIGDWGNVSHVSWL